MITDLHKWARLFAAFAITLGLSWSLLSSAPGSAGSLSGYRADLLWPAAVLGAVAIVMGLLAFRLQWVAERQAAERRAADRRTVA
jgi:hypothetical protein